jgi:hypothetical protein
LKKVNHAINKWFLGTGKPVGLIGFLQQHFNALNDVDVIFCWKHPSALICISLEFEEHQNERFL